MAVGRAIGYIYGQSAAKELNSVRINENKCGND